MREESHLDDMRSAIRGDFERLAERRGGQELMSVEDAVPEQDPAEPEPRPEAVPQPEAERDPEPEPEREDELPGSWIDRLLGR